MLRTLEHLKSFQGTTDLFEWSCILQLDQRLFPVLMTTEPGSGRGEQSRNPVDCILQTSAHVGVEAQGNKCVFLYKSWASHLIWWWHLLIGNFWIGYLKLTIQILDKLYPESTLLGTKWCKVTPPNNGSAVFFKPCKTQWCSLGGWQSVLRFH